jgi:lysozyme family protein
MADFRPAAEYILVNEDPHLLGEIVQDPTVSDPKAIARFGVNSAAHPEAVREGFFEMSHDAALQYAEDVIKFHYFSPIGGYSIIVQDIANKFCDLAFNEGVNQATKIVQRAVIAALPGIILTLDGIAGLHTTTAINDCAPEKLLPAIKDKAKDFYMAVVAAHPEKQNQLKGWLARVDK